MAANLNPAVLTESLARHLCGPCWQSATTLLGEMSIDLPALAEDKKVNLKQALGAALAGQSDKFEQLDTFLKARQLMSDGPSPYAVRFKLPPTPNESTGEKFLAGAKAKFWGVAQYVQDSKLALRALRHPTILREMTLALPIGGKTAFVYGVFACYQPISPSKGGIRFDEGVTRDTVKALAFDMMIKNAVGNLPFSGGKCGLRVDNTLLTREERELLARTFIRSMGPELGPRRYVPGPDMGTSDLIDVMADEYESVHGEWVPAVITGKSIARGGSEGRPEATGRGAFHVFQSYLREHVGRHSFPNGRARIAIQGFGGAAQPFAELASKDSNIVAISDRYGSMYNEHGIDVTAAIAAVKKTGRLPEYNGPTDPADVLFLPNVDVIVPAATEGQLRADNASRVTAKLSVEIANGPTQTDADEILRDNGVVVLPDVLANLGGVTVSSFEWKQGLLMEEWALATVRERLETSMVGAYTRVSAAQQRHQVDFRTAAHIVALERIVGQLTPLYR